MTRQAAAPAPASGGHLAEGRLSAPVAALWERYYGDRPANRFGELLLASVGAGDRVLEIGAGSGAGTQNRFPLGGRVAHYAGIDPDPAVLQNPHLDEAHCCGCEALPFADKSFDVVFHCFVAEHLSSPEICHREIFRVLKPGGRLLFQTPSKYHYAILAARLTPHRFHSFYVGRFGSGRKAHEVFSTYYRLNDRAAVRRVLGGCGFTWQVEYESAPPGYLRFSRAAFLAGVLFERGVESRLPPLRARLIVTAARPV